MSCPLLYLPSRTRYSSCMFGRSYSCASFISLQMCGPIPLRSKYCNATKPGESEFLSVVKRLHLIILSSCNDWDAACNSLGNVSSSGLSLRHETTHQKYSVRANCKMQASPTLFSLAFSFGKDKCKCKVLYVAGMHW